MFACSIAHYVAEQHLLRGSSLREAPIKHQATDDSSFSVRMSEGYTDYLWSQANADLGFIDAAATPAQDAFVIMKQIKSHIHMVRIAGLQGQLSQLDNKHIEVIRLGVMVQS